jgi:hypothetical protein
LDESREAENITTICWDNGARVVGTTTSIDPVTRAETGTTASSIPREGYASRAHTTSTEAARRPDRIDRGCLYA